MSHSIANKCFAEFLGTFALVFFGCGSMILHEINPPAISVDSIPIIFGLVVSAMIYGLGPVSGAHFNPAVSIAFYHNRNISLRELCYYITSQIIGAVLASFSHSFFFGKNHSFGMTINKLTASQGVSLEILISMFLMLTIISVATNEKISKSIAGFSIGSIIAVCSFVAGPFTGASMNPARSIGPAILANNYNDIVLYLLAPIIGMLIANYMYNSIKEI